MIWMILLMVSLKVPGPIIHYVCFENDCVQVELAVTHGEQSRGLMFREQLPANHGMLFVYPGPVRSQMYMKNMRIPLDILWLDDHQRVVHIEKNVPVCTEEPCVHYAASVPSLYALEVNAGFTDEFGIKNGAEAVFRSRDKMPLEKGENFRYIKQQMNKR